MSSPLPPEIASRTRDSARQREAREKEYRFSEASKTIGIEVSILTPSRAALQSETSMFFTWLTARGALEYWHTDC